MAQLLICPRCGAHVSWPCDLSEDARRQIGLEARSTGLLALNGAIQREIGMGLAEHKSLFFHLTRTKGQCHRCKRALSAVDSICEGCQSANLDW